MCIFIYCTIVPCFAGYGGQVRIIGKVMSIICNIRF